MLHKDKKSISTKASAFWTIKAFAALMLLIMLALPVTAHPPAQVSLAYDSQNQSLNVTTTHAGIKSRQPLCLQDCRPEKWRASLN